MARDESGNAPARTTCPSGSQEPRAPSRESSIGINQGTGRLEMVRIGAIVRVFFSVFVVVFLFWLLVVF